MERQLKERLIGAAVLVAAAVVLVPEMFSGSGSSSPLTTTTGTTTPAPGQLKTYRIDLHAAQPAAAPEAMTIDAPTEPPQDELPVNAASDAMLAASSSSAASVWLAPVASSSAASVHSSSSKASVAPPTVATSPSAATVTPGNGNWVVQVGSFGAQNKAQRIANDLKDQGYPAFVAPVAVSGKTFYRVRVGAMNERAAAEAMLQKLQKAYPGASVAPANR